MATIKKASKREILMVTLCKSISFTENKVLRVIYDKRESDLKKLGLPQPSLS